MSNQEGGQPGPREAHGVSAGWPGSSAGRKDVTYPHKGGAGVRDTCRFR